MNQINDFFIGIFDSLFIIPVFANLFKSRKVFQSIINCLLFNGFLLLGSYFLFMKLIQLTNDEIMIKILNVLFYIIILLPLFLVCNVLSSFWIDDIYLETLIIYEKTTNITVEGQGFLIKIANQIQRLLIIICFLIQQFVVSLLPFGYFIGVISMAILHSIYVFEYILLQKYIKDYVSILFFLERKIFYFIGFGMIFTLLVVNLSSSFITSSAWFLLCFPFYLMLSIPIAKKRFDDLDFTNENEKGSKLYALVLVNFLYHSLLKIIEKFIDLKRKRHSIGKNKDDFINK